MALPNEFRRFEYDAYGAAQLISPRQLGVSMSVFNSPVIGPALLCFIISSIIVVAAVAVVLCVYFVYKKKHDFLKKHLGITSVSSRVQDAAGVNDGSAGTGSDENASEFRFDDEYLKDALSQSTMQFYLSVFASLTGFVLIIAVIIVALVQGDIEIALGTLPGVVINIVSALFFKQAKDTRDLAAALYGQNMHRINVSDSQDIAEKIEDRKLKSIVLATLTLNLASTSATPADNLQELLKCIGQCSADSPPDNSSSGGSSGNTSSGDSSSGDSASSDSSSGDSSSGDSSSGGSSSTS
jgi:uncharacterized membrane protein YgcG